MRKIFALLLCAALMLGFGALPVMADSETRQAEITYRDIKIVLDGQPLNLCDAAGNPVEPFILDGTTYLPVRAVADALGLKVRWRESDSRVMLERPYETILDKLSMAPPETPRPAQTPAPGHNARETVTLNYRGIRIMLDGMLLQLKDREDDWKTVEPFVLDGTTYLPVRAVAEALGLAVDWDGASGTVYLNNYLLSKDTTKLKLDENSTETVECVYGYDARGNNVSFRQDHYFLSGNVETTELRTSYDELGRTVSREYSRRSGQEGYEHLCTTGYVYDNKSGRCLYADTVIKSGGAVYSGRIEYEYDGSGRLTGAKDSPAVIVNGKVHSGFDRTFTISYDGEGRISRESLTVVGKKEDSFLYLEPLSVTYSYVYDGDGRRASVDLNTGAESVIQYDAFGEAVSMPGSITWTYDSHGREIKAEYRAVYNGEERVTARTECIYSLNTLTHTMYYGDMLGDGGYIGYNHLYDGKGNVIRRMSTVTRHGTGFIEDLEYIKVGD